MTKIKYLTFDEHRQTYSHHSEKSYLDALKKGHYKNLEDIPIKAKISPEVSANVPANAKRKPAKKAE